MNFPIPADALDDRLGFIGTSGSGKTYNAGGAVERILQHRARVVIVDPLGVWWGLRLLADGKTPSPHQVAIFGGPHGDLALNEHAGALIGEAAATTAESCIIDLSELGTKAAERRFMVAFLDTSYRKASGEPFHIVVDEADLFAPQRPPSGDETLLNHMEQIVRRGRVKGFIPWLISQRPAVLNKNVLSQVDGLIAFKLTSSQDRDALDAWIEGQADRVEGRAIKDALPAMQIGQGVVWVPGRGILETATFPPKATFDSSRTPKRGEKIKATAKLKPLDLGVLREKLATVEAEKKASDPRTLRARIAELERDEARKPAIDPAALEQRWAAGYEQGKADQAAAFAEQMRQMQAAIDGALGFLMAHTKRVPAPPVIDQVAKRALLKPTIAAAPAINGEAITTPQRRVLDALAWWLGARIDNPTRTQVAAVAGYSPTSGGFNNLLGQLRSSGRIEYGIAGCVALTEAGIKDADLPARTPTTAELHDRIERILSAPQARVLRAIIGAYPEAAERGEIAAACEYSPTSGGFNNLLGSLRSLGFIEYPSPRRVVASPILFIV